MKVDKTKLLQDIKAMKEKLASMEQELNKPDVFKHFPSKGDFYYTLCSDGATLRLIANDDSLLVRTYKTKEEAHKAHNKDVALEKVKRRLLELQGEWKPNFNDTFSKYVIIYNYDKRCFEDDAWRRVNYLTLIPYIKTSEIVRTIINEMSSELEVIFDIT